MELKLINEVKRYKYLYDRHDELYKNINIKTTAWERISKKLNMKVEFVKKRWKTLRDRYTRYKKTKRTELSKNRAWKYHEAMSFLDKVQMKSESEESDSGEEQIPSQTKSNQHSSQKKKPKDGEKIMLDVYSDVSELIKTAKTAFSQTTSLRKFLHTLAVQTEKANLPQDKFFTLQIELLSIVHDAIRQSVCED